VTAARDAARAVLTTEAEPTLLAALDAAEADGSARWVYDPQVAGVVGLVTPAGPALAVVYLASLDFEVAAALEVGA
jgi:hypothetical protein